MQWQYQSHRIQIFYQIILLFLSCILNVAASQRRTNFVLRQIYMHNLFITNTTVLKDKYEQMNKSSFDFYRATAHLFYADILQEDGALYSAIPNEWKRVVDIDSGSSSKECICNPLTWIEGDAHVLNIGFFDNSKGEIKFDLNDFDEAVVGPFYLDLLRFGSSLFLSTDKIDSISESINVFLDSYKAFMKELNDDDKKRKTEFTYRVTKETEGSISKKIKKLKSKRNLATLLDKYTEVAQSRRVLKRSNVTVDVEADWSDVAAGWADYRKRLQEKRKDKKFSDAYFTIKDKALRLDSGLGSLGVVRYIVLIEGPTSDPSDDVVLDVKETRPPSFPSAWASTQAHRTIFAAKAMLRHVDAHLGEVIGRRSYVVKAISPYKASYDINSTETVDNDFLLYSGRVYALAHSRSYKDVSKDRHTSSFEASFECCLDTWNKFVKTLIAIAGNYSDQVREDLLIVRANLKCLLQGVPNVFEKCDKSIYSDTKSEGMFNNPYIEFSNIDNNDDNEDDKDNYNEDDNKDFDEFQIDEL